MLTVSELRDRAPDLNAIAGFNAFRFLEGPERDVIAVEVRTGSGFEYTVVPDRGMNVARARYKGVPLDWSSGTGIVAPAFTETDGWKWLRSFNGGLVHLCGLDNVGNPVHDEEAPGDNKDFGGHGRISSTPARGVSWRFLESEDDVLLEISGTLHAISATEEHLRLERRIVSELAGTRLTLHDRVTNLGAGPTPVFLLYHCNFGYPILSEDSELRIPCSAASDPKGNLVPGWEVFEPPGKAGGEQVIYPVIDAEAVRVELYNPKLNVSGGPPGLGIYLSYERSALPFLTIWKKLTARHYVLGLEPGTCRVEGRREETRAGRAHILDRDETIEIALEIGVLREEVS